jgi:hypothetical protein
MKIHVAVKIIFEMFELRGTKGVKKDSKQSLQNQ